MALYFLIKTVFFLSHQKKRIPRKFLERLESFSIFVNHYCISVSRGGAENKAFDPSPEAQLHGEFHNLPPDFARRAEHTFEQNGFSSFDDEDEEEESVTPRASESDFVLHEGRSTFYSDSKEEETTEEAAKDTISTSSTQKLEDELEDKNDDDVFEDATLKLDENGKGKKPSLTS